VRGLTSCFSIHPEGLVHGISADRFDVHLPLPLAFYHLDVDLVILGMGADKADVDHAIALVAPDHQPVLVPGCVEHHPAILEYAGISEVLLNLEG
jgi:hypothetical protein